MASDLYLLPEHDIDFRHIDGFNRFIVDPAVHDAGFRGRWICIATLIVLAICEQASSGAHGSIEPGQVGAWVLGTLCDDARICSANASRYPQQFAMIVG